MNSSQSLGLCLEAAAERAPMTVWRYSPVSPLDTLYPVTPVSVSSITFDLWQGVFVVVVAVMMVVIMLRVLVFLRLLRLFLVHILSRLHVHKKPPVIILVMGH